MLLACGIHASTCLAQRETPGEIESKQLQQAVEAGRNLLSSVMTPRALVVDGSKVRETFRETVAEARRATVRVRVNGRNRSLGGVIGPDGWVLTKASMLRTKEGGERITVRLSDYREFDARVVGVDRDYDLAMLKVDAKELPTLDLTTETDLRPGDWLATVGVDRDPVAIGVLSVAPRKIPHRPGILGVQLGNPSGKPAGALVLRVYPKTGAEEAGVLANDVLTAINGEPIKNRSQLIKEVRKYSPGDTLEVDVLREGATVRLQVTLTGRNRVVRMSRSEFQNSLGGVLSQRRFGFPSAMQHDTTLEASECGGPIVDLDGSVVGFNLARSGRTESYAVSTAELPERLFALMSGSMPPGEGGDEPMIDDEPTLDGEPAIDEDSPQSDGLGGDAADDTGLKETVPSER